MKRKAVTPPARVSRERAASNGFSGFGLTNTEFGDRVEAAIAQMPGWHAMVGKSAGKPRQGCFDVEAPDGRWCEVKAVSVFAAEYKAKPKAREMTTKVKAAKKAGRRPAMVIAVVDLEMRAWIFVRSGLGSYRLGSTGLGWEFAGVTSAI